MRCRPDILITTWSDSPSENVPTLSSVSRILLLLISGEKAEKGTPLYGLYGDVPLDRLLFVRRRDFNSPVESVKRQTDPYGKAMKK